jgi:hypothetical protein
MSKKTTGNQLLTRSVLTGGAIGLYFGFFFRPAREPNLLFVLGLAILISLVMTGIKAYRERPSLVVLLKSAAGTFLKAILFLTLLELRHPVYDYGGRMAVTIFMTLMGMAAGFLYAYDQMRNREQS